jgi:putative thioredoxin
MYKNDPASGWVHTVHYEDFQERVVAASNLRPVLVDLWADWCAPCRLIEPVLERVITDYAGRVHLARVEVDDGENMRVAGHYRVRGFPTVILFEQGEERGRFHGALPARHIVEFIVQHSRML